ncbi:hypothetical protein A2U01_0097405, partial [Trifolium medium]|nr:hypothetical protein [Trifolium medium]
SCTLLDRTGRSKNVDMQPESGNWPQEKQHKTNLLVALVMVEEVVVV